MTNNPISFFVSGIPKPQPRPRVTKTGHAYNPPTSDAWKAAVQAEALRHLRGNTITGGVLLEIIFCFPIARTAKHVLGEWHTQTPDCDNAIKAVMDALTGIGAWKDDRQVCRVCAEKFFVTGPKAGARITIREVER